MLFKKYDHVKNKDGTYDILGVPIFKLGKIRGFSYTKKWFKKTQENHKADEDNDYFPSVIIGHNDGKEEKPSRGLFRNLKLNENDNILADLIKIPEKIFNKIKDREFPHRSIEVVPKDNKITALALLGGTTPYHKLPILEIFSDDDEHEILSFNMNADEDLEFDTTISEEAANEEKRSNLRRIVDSLSSRLWKVLRIAKDEEELSNKMNEVLEDGTKAIKNATKQKNKEENLMDTKEKFSQKELDQAKIDSASEATETFREDFKTEHGMYPKEFAEKQKKDIADAKKAAIVTFCEKLKTEDRGDGKILSPAIVDEVIQPFMQAEGDTIKFGAEELDIDAAVEHVIGEIIKFAAEGKLFTDMKEKSKHGDNKDIKTGFDDDGSIDPETMTIHKRAVKYQAENDCDYETAISAITVNL